MPFGELFLNTLSNRNDKRIRLSGVTQCVQLGTTFEQKILGMITVVGRVTRVKVL